MGDGNIKRKPFRARRLSRGFLVQSVVVFLLLVVVGGTLFALAMRHIIRNDKRAALVRVLDDTRRKLEQPTVNKIRVVMEMAWSPLIRQYFADPANSRFATMAIERFAACQKALVGNTVFWVTDADKKFYSDGKFVYTVDPEDSVNYWYNMTMHQDSGYNFNINYNPDLNNFNLWINAPVFDSVRKPIGVLGAGIDISAFIKTLYDGYKESAELYLFNSGAEITAAADVEIVAVKRRVHELFGETGNDIRNAAAELNDGETRILNTPIGEVGITAVPLFEWYAVAILRSDSKDYQNTMTWLFFATLAVVGLVLIALNIFISSTSSASSAGKR